MTKLIFAFGILFINFPLLGQLSDYSNKISTHIELLRDSIFVGQPIFIEYVLTNNSNKSIFVEEGGDYRSGRKNSFEVYIINSNNDTLRKRDLWGFMGGLMTYHEIKPKASRKFKLFLPMWGNITNADNYKLSVSKDFPIAPSNPFIVNDFSIAEKVPKKSIISLPVVEDSIGLGEFISTMVKEIKAETKGRIIEGSKFKSGEHTYKSISPKLLEYQRIISELKDERIVPFSIECYIEEQHYSKNRVVNYLTQFPNNNEAFEILIAAAQGKDNSKYDLFEDSIGIYWSSSYTRQVALQAIMNSQNKKAIDFLFSKKNDEFPHERIAILTRAKGIMKSEDRLKLYEAFYGDSHKAVAKKARMELELFEKEIE